MKIEIRAMVPEDADQVAAVEEQCFAMPWSRQSFWEEASHQETIYLLAIDRDNNDQVVGYVGCWVLSGEGDITNVAVAPAYRRKGVARKLLERLIELLKEQQVTAVTLEARASNTPAIVLYQSLGFKSVGLRPRYYTNPVEDAEIMWKTDMT